MAVDTPLVHSAKDVVANLEDITGIWISYTKQGVNKRMTAGFRGLGGVTAGLRVEGTMQDLSQSRFLL